MWYLKQIPKIAHFYWGGDRLSYLRYLSIKSFAVQNPDWEIRLHVPVQNSTVPSTWHQFDRDQIDQQDWRQELTLLDVTIAQHNFQDYGFDNTAHEVHKSDFLRWRVLANDGGLWSDMDILYCAPMSQLVENTKKNSKLNTGLVPLIAPGKHTVGFLLSSSSNEFYQHISATCTTRYDPNVYQCMGSNLLNQYKALEEFNDHFPRNNFAFLNKNCVYFVSAKSVEDFFKPLNHITVKRMRHPAIIGYHWFAGHPVSREFEQKFSPSMIDQYNNLITTVIKTKGYLQ